MVFKKVLSTGQGVVFEKVLSTGCGIRKGAKLHQNYNSLDFIDKVRDIGTLAISLKNYFLSIVALKINDLFAILIFIVLNSSISLRKNIINNFFLTILS